MSSGGEAGPHCAAASEEFPEAVRCYEAERVGLGGEFYDAVFSTVDLVREHPEIGVAVGGPHPHRQFLVDGFPQRADPLIEPPLQRRLCLARAPAGQ